MSALKKLLESFEWEPEVNNSNGHEPGYWMYYGDISPKQAAAELARLQKIEQAARGVLGLALGLKDDDEYFFDKRNGQEICDKLATALDERANSTTTKTGHATANITYTAS